MKIGIIGSGNIGGALTRRFRVAGHEVMVSNSRGPASLTELALETGARAVSVRDAARENDVVVVAIPLTRVEDLPPGLFADAPVSMIVVDTGNYYPRYSEYSNLPPPDCLSPTATATLHRSAPPRAPAYGALGGAVRSRVGRARRCA